MFNHTPTEIAPGVYRCACGFYGITTGDGIHVVESGAGRQLHLAAIAERQIATRAMVEQQIKRLIEAYREHRVLPVGPGRPHALTKQQTRQLSKYIKAEHGL